MEKIRFQQQLQAYDQWKANVINTIEDYAPWLEENNMSTPDMLHTYRAYAEYLKKRQINHRICR